MLDAVDLYEHLIQMPLPLRHLAHVVSTRFADLLGEMSAEVIYPETDAFVADINPTLVKQVFDIAKRKRKPDIHHHGKLNDLG